MATLKIVKVVGGLGSQMFAYALSLALKKHYVDDIVIADFSGYRYGLVNDHNGAELNRVFGLEEGSTTGLLQRVLHSRHPAFRAGRKVLELSRILPVLDARERNYNFDERVFSLVGSYRLHQCWTSYKYFTAVEDLVRASYTFASVSCPKCLSLTNVIMKEDSVALHVRRGDYVDNPGLGGLAPLRYYIEALGIVTNKVPRPVFFLFSDDPGWVVNNLVPYIKQPYYLIDFNKASESWRDMYLMSLCKNFIIPNSSFSWWAAFLSASHNKTIVAPRFWGNRSKGVFADDMNMPGWIQLDNRI